MGGRWNGKGFNKREREEGRGGGLKGSECGEFTACVREYVPCIFTNFFLVSWSCDFHARISVVSCYVVEFWSSFTALSLSLSHSLTFLGLGVFFFLDVLLLILFILFCLI